ncbi:VanZ family protein [Phycicoccus endophyticus]|uniref:VanZ family protein n=1 Tax=Phycicoccus endophyticus TaxID=1690220 RepID=A0A7G9QYJ8_9MICO|nr:VanZ family protein [Phycicoccus endophyticus]NHI19327.1 hypothetical protein [Phycicoccus endophyticus]QNN48423.1 VanZ family protein [Phycicoccus endophyticus]GGL41888.1 hypothetical protein GCM10012283_25620 [Phycicoccus endophyticus]
MRQLTAVGWAGTVLAPLVVAWALSLVDGRARGWGVWPRVAAVVVGAAAATAAALTGWVDNFWRWLEPASWSTVIVVVGLATVVATCARHPLRLSRNEWLWSAAALSLYWVATLPARRLAPTSAGTPSDRLVRCVAGIDRFVPTSFADLTVDVLPNAVLCAPLGLLLGVTHVGWRRSLATLLVMAASIEAYQALFTHSTCAPRDVVANCLGALAGLLLARAAPRAPTPVEG